MNLDTRIILVLILCTCLIFLMVYMIKKIKVWIKTKRERKQRRNEERKEIIRKLQELKTEKTKPSISKKEELTQSTEKDRLSSKGRYEKYLESIQDTLLESKMMLEDIQNIQKGYIQDIRKIPSEVRQKVWKRDNGRCVKCGSKEKLQFDHIIPVSKGGGYSVENTQILCQECNLKKQTKLNNDKF